MRILVLGGTIFLGRHIVAAALERGHRLTLFNRGRSNPHLFPQVEKLRGDRQRDLSPLQGRRWDVVIDTCGYLPRVVGASAELLANAVDLYIFISSASVYADLSRRRIGESAPLAVLADPSAEASDGTAYGPLKALCEEAVQERMPGRALIVRPGLIVGPHDPSGRFTYWVERVARGGEVLVPAPPGRQVQFIDVRDLADWILRCAERGVQGAYNAAGPEEPLPMVRLLEVCRRVSGSEATVTWVDEAFLLQHDVQPWTELPLWLPAEFAGMMALDCRKALAAGLTFRPLAETVRDTLAWSASDAAAKGRPSGMRPEREWEILRAWHARR